MSLKCLPDTKGFGLDVIEEGTLVSPPIIEHNVGTKKGAK